MAKVVLIFFCAHMLAYKCSMPMDIPNRTEEVVDLRKVMDDYITEAFGKYIINMKSSPSYAIPNGYWNIQLPGSEFTLSLKMEDGRIEWYTNLQRVGDIGVYENNEEIMLYVNVEPVDLRMSFGNYILVGSKFYANGALTVIFNNFTFNLQLKIIARPECRPFVISAYCTQDLANCLEFENVRLHPDLQREEVKIKECLLQHFYSNYLAKLNYLYVDTFDDALQVFDLCGKLKLNPDEREMLPS